jgi:hypothetical protein
MWIRIYPLYFLLYVFISSKPIQQFNKMTHNVIVCSIINKNAKVALAATVNNSVNQTLTHQNDNFIINCAITQHVQSHYLFQHESKWKHLNNTNTLKLQERAPGRINSVVNWMRLKKFILVVSFRFTLSIALNLMESQQASMYEGRRPNELAVLGWARRLSALLLMRRYLLHTSTCAALTWRRCSYNKAIMILNTSQVSNYLLTVISNQAYM